MGDPGEAESRECRSPQKSGSGPPADGLADHQIAEAGQQDQYAGPAHRSGIDAQENIGKGIVRGCAQPQRSSRRRNQPGCRIAQGLDGHRIAEYRIRPGEDSKRHTAGSGIEDVLPQSAEGLLDDADGKEVSGDHPG